MSTEFMVDTIDSKIDKFSNKVEKICVACGGKGTKTPTFMVDFPGLETKKKTKSSPFACKRCNGTGRVPLNDWKIIM